MIDIAGTTLSALDRERLSHPQVGGMILFARNYENPAQLTQLCAEIHALRSPPLPIAVDHEGGRVQRFRSGFTVLPAMRQLGEWWDRDAQAACAAAHAMAYVLAAELRACGVDLSFAPVLDLDYGHSSVIGDRAFHRKPQAVVELAGAFIDGLRQADMVACGKHFPGHGHVAADSHIAIPVDERSLDELAEDMQPYRQLSLDGVMPAHVIYPRVDPQPAGFSMHWLKMLREDFSFDGVIFSDDLSMEGASVAGDIVARAEAAWSAGCDMLLVCNAPEAVAELLARWQPPFDAQRSRRVERLIPAKPALAKAVLEREPTWQQGCQLIAALG
ncbi:MAG: beta-N-acetylhexosaminidase [Sterolibacterium sp.]|jgi:beta-N-acetylhexosaminidase|nr:beta-N-acetylhexosaminidase [Sterolibacterium sp.]